MWRSLFGGAGSPTASTASQAALASSGAAACSSGIDTSFIQPHAALFKDCDACLRDAQPVTTLCERGHELCFCCSLQTFAAALSDASTHASGGVLCPMCRADGEVLWTPTGSLVSGDAPPVPLAGWITPSCVQRLEAWGATASAAERTIAPSAPPVAPLTPSQLRQYALRVAERALAHRAWLQHGGAAADGFDHADAGSAAVAPSPALLSPALIAGWLLPPPPPACVPTPWELCGRSERLVACPSAACGASFALRRAGDLPPASADASATSGTAASERSGDAATAFAFCSVCPHCSTPLCADCGQSWTASITLLQPSSASTPAAPSATPRGGLFSTLLSLGSSAASSSGVAAPETVTVCHAGLACGPYSELVDRLRDAGGRLLSAEEKAALRALASKAGAVFDRSGAGAGTSSGVGSGAAADANRQAEEAAFGQQVLHMAKAGIKYCPQCGCPGEFGSCCVADSLWLRATVLLTRPILLVSLLAYLPCPLLCRYSPARTRCVRVRAGTSMIVEISRGTQSQRLCVTVRRPRSTTLCCFPRFPSAACHHISPGTGCPNCGTHYCFVCLGAFVGRMQFACLRGCPGFCNDLCGARAGSRAAQTECCHIAILLIMMPPP